MIAALKEEFDGTNLSVSVNPQTGAISFDSNVLFDFSKDDLKESGKQFLQEFLPRYFSILLSPEYKDYLAEIIIEGHTDTVGGYLSNLNLSQRRALSVATYCLDENGNVLSNEQIGELRKIVTANGRSYSNPILDSNGNVDMDASRRVEFMFRLKDDEMVDEMMKILNK